jgi:hypothetical protein
MSPPIVYSTRLLLRKRGKNAGSSKAEKERRKAFLPYG